VILLSRGAAREVRERRERKKVMKVREANNMTSEELVSADSTLS
jgi:hypothetical protein